MKKTAVLLAVGAMFAAGASAQTKVIAHRGYWNIEGSAQNSIQSLSEADRINCFGSECDVWLTKDGVSVVFHDHIIRDKNGVAYVIEDTDYKKIKNIKLPNGEKLPTFAEYIAQAKKGNTRLIVELKTQKNTPEAHQTAHATQIVDMINKAGLASQTEYIAFSLFITKELVRLAPDNKVYYLNGELSPAQLKEIGCAGLDYSRKVMKAHPEWFAEARELGLEVNVWTVNDKDEMEYFIAQGADYITTDAPELLQSLLK